MLISCLDLRLNFLCTLNSQQQASRTAKPLSPLSKACLPALPIDIAAINHELWRRQQGYGRGGRMKIETDTVEILSGVRHGKTLGSPIALMIKNDDFVHWEEVMSVEGVSSPHVSKGSDQKQPT